MEIFEPLPHHLNAAGGQRISHDIHQRLMYLWKSCHEFALSSVILSHSLSKKFKELVSQHNIMLPSNFDDRLCSKCCVIQLPSLTCTVRLQKIRKRKFNCVNSDNTVAQINKSVFKNVMVIAVCYSHICNFLHSFNLYL